MRTTDHLYELQISIITALNNDSTLGGIINVVYTNVPNDAKFPFVAVDNIAAEDVTSRTTSGWHIKMAINVFSRARDNQELSNILSEIRRILDGASLSPTNCSVVGIKESGSFIARQKDSITWHGVISFNIILQQGSGAFIAGGNNFVIKIGNGATPTETFTVIGGLRNAGIKLANKIVNYSNLSTGRWQGLVSGSGITSVAISGSGFFTDSAAEDSLCGLAFSGNINNYQVILGGGDVISGAFIISLYKRAGNVNTEELVDITLESSGAVTFTAS